MSDLIRAVLALLIVAGVSPAMQAEEGAPGSLAEQAIAARYQAEKLSYEKQRWERTAKGAEGTIQQTQKSLPQLKAAVEKAKQDRQAAQDELDKVPADADRQVAERLLKQKETAYQRELGSLQRNEERLKKSQMDVATAQTSIPLLEAQAKEAQQQADALKTQTLEAERHEADGERPNVIGQRIDRIVDARLASERIAASAQSDDAEFLRRVSLDITGVIPRYEDVLAFLEDSSSDKRAAAIDRLLADAAYGRNFAQRFCTVTTENGTSTLEQGRDYFNAWLAESLNLNRRWDRVVTDMLAAEGPGFEQPGALFTVAYRMNEQPDPALLLAAAGDYLLGLQIQCAQCHDHPFYEWKHDEFWSMAAMFGRVRLKGQSQQGRELEHLVTDDDVDPKELVRMNGIKYPEQLPGGKIGIPDPVNAGQTLRTVSARFLDGAQPELPEKGNYRKAFASWVTAKDNPYFARATVNRLWAHFFGRGIVEPITNLHPNNKPSHPELLDLLADEFKRSDYDLKHLVRAITASQAYQRSSKPLAGNEQDEKLFSHMAVKPLDSFVLVDSLCVALRRNPPTGTRRRDEAALYDTRLPGGDPQKYTHSIPQVLKLMNTKDHAEAGATVQTVTRGRPAAEAIGHLYLAVLSRQPTSAETEQMVQYVSQLNDERRGYADVFWVLLNSAEFLVNH